MCRPLQHDEIVGRANQVFIAVFPYDDLILDADASPAGNIESRLDGGHDIFLIDSLGPRSDKRNLVDKEADAVADSVVMVLVVGKKRRCAARATASQKT